MRRHLTASAIRVLSRPSAIDYSEPCIIKNTIAHWPAMRKRHWHPRRLQKLYGNRLFEWGVGTHSNETLLISLSRFLSLKHPLSRRRCYLFDSTFDTDCPELLDDYIIPPLFQFGCQDMPSSLPSPNGQLMPSSRWFLVGHAGSGSQLHTDPPHTSAWNALVYGLKEWVVIQPDSWHDSTSCSQHPALSRSQTSEDAFYMRTRQRSTSASLHRWFRKDVSQLWRHAHYTTSASCNAVGSSFTLRVMRFTQRAGDIVYIPHGWQHAVLNRCLSVAVTHNFVCPDGKSSTT
jgi:hypothetical protein